MNHLNAICSSDAHHMFRHVIHTFWRWCQRQNKPSLLCLYFSGRALPIYIFYQNGRLKKKLQNSTEFNGNQEIGLYNVGSYALTRRISCCNRITKSILILMERIWFDWIHSQETHSDIECGCSSAVWFFRFER